MSGLMSWSSPWLQYNPFDSCCSIRHLSVPFDVCLFHSTFGCSIHRLSIPFHICLFHSTFVCSIWHLVVPFDRPFNVWLFHSMFGCSIWCLAVPFDDWLIQLQSSCGLCHVTMVTLFCLEFGCFTASFIAVSLYDWLFYFSLSHSIWCATVSFVIMLVYLMPSWLLIYV